MVGSNSGKPVSEALRYVGSRRSNYKAYGVTQETPIWPGLVAGVMATLVGIGLARFAYTPLIPVLIDAGWFSASDAVYLGAANLLGYFIGALSAHRLT